MPQQEFHVVLGAGPLGRALAAELAGRGSRVRLISRRGCSLAPGIEAVAADLTDLDQQMVAGARTIYFCAGPRYDRWPQAFPRLQDAAIAAARRTDAVLVAAENFYGYGIGGQLTEAQPLAATTRKGAVRAQMSRRLLEAHRLGEVRAVSGRASDFIGPEVRASALGERAWPALLAGRRIDWFGDPDAVRSFTFVPDFARALIRLGDEEQAWGRSWHVPSLAPIAPAALLARAAELAGVAPPRIARTPAAILRLVGLFQPAAAETIEIGYAYAGPLVLSTEAWESAFPERATGLDTVLRATIDWWRSVAIDRSGRVPAANA